MTERHNTVTANFLRQRLSHDLSQRVLDRYEAGFYEDAVLHAFKTVEQKFRTALEEPHEQTSQTTPATYRCYELCGKNLRTRECKSLYLCGFLYTDRAAWTTFSASRIVPGRLTQKCEVCCCWSPHPSSGSL